MLASITDEEIEECKRRVLLGNSPTKRTLPKTWAMYLFSSGKSLCEESAIVRVKMDMVMGTGREQQHHSRLWN